MYINPYCKVNDKKGQWLKGNFHTHAGTGPDTCGAYEIDEVISLYKEAGYGVLSISNHDLLTDVGEYQQRYGMILLNAFEYSTDPHMLCIHVNHMKKEAHQEAILNCKQQGGFAVLCHPNWQRKEYWPWKDIDMLFGYCGIEIYNGLISRLSGSGLATDTWDYLLSQGKLVWGFGNDDFHRWYDLANAWTTLYCEGDAHEDVIQSINEGSFYASSGLILREFCFEDNTISISAAAKDAYVKDYCYIFIRKDGEVLSRQQGESGQYHLKGHELYVRMQVISEHGAMLWTQPIYREELFRKP